MKLTRRYRFSASHRLHSAALSDSDNHRIYGKCNNPFGHGHDYVLDVTVAGPLDEDTGRIVDLEKLDTLVAEQILRPFDHRDLNREAAAFLETPPTTENLAVEVGRRLGERWRDAFNGSAARLEKIRIEETKRNSVELSL
jgi:6-pyruvoyltetrahydropterin/6-carboxytetrahydropterin synthase